MRSRILGIFGGKYSRKHFAKVVAILSKHSEALGFSRFQRPYRTTTSGCVAEDIIKIQFEHWQRPKIFEDTKPFLQSVRGLTTLILSNIDTKDIHEAIRYHDIHFNDVITSEDFKSYKPNPELFKEALLRYNLDPIEVIHIGDSILSDVCGAQNVGIKTIWLNRPNEKSLRHKSGLHM
ncbi:HAD family hydrolase [Paenibacillus sp. S28]|uniref:HAD family hydrolase n=1 Tax=Paenibacillus sp. S28 TaxID=2767463 RepID=UPI002D7F1919|nr:HAD family hydrolase [Paenibacillus sp. S28]